MNSKAWSQAGRRELHQRNSHGAPLPHSPDPRWPRRLGGWDFSHAVALACSTIGRTVSAAEAQGLVVRAAYSTAREWMNLGSAA